MYFSIPWEINYIIFPFVLAFALVFLLHISKHSIVILTAREFKKNEPKWPEFRGIPTYVQFDLRKVARHVAVAYVGEWLYKATLSGVRHERQLTVNVWALRLYVFGLCTVLLYVKKDDIKMRARLEVNTGSLFYPTNIFCYFLSALIA